MNPVEWYKDLKNLIREENRRKGVNVIVKPDAYLNESFKMGAIQPDWTKPAENLRKILTCRGFQEYPSTQHISTTDVPACDPTQYYFRDLSGGFRSQSQNRQPTFYYFIDHNIRIDEFLGFLMPPLDYGHGSEKKDPKDKYELILDTALDEQWLRYLIILGQKLNERKQAQSKRSNAGRRIIFWDKELFELFFHLSEKRHAFDGAYVEKNDEGQLAYLKREEDPEMRYLRKVIKTVYDTIWIHKVCFQYKIVIECRYVDRATIMYSQNYDFGLYKVQDTGGTKDVVYSPISLMDMHETTCQERVIIGDTVAQQTEIEGYRRDFSVLWKDQFKQFYDDIPSFEHRKSFQRKVDTNYNGTLDIEVFHKTYFKWAAERFDHVFKYKKIREGS
jgi:hypothetical protein